MNYFETTDTQRFNFRAQGSVTIWTMSVKNGTREFENHKTKAVCGLANCFDRFEFILVTTPNAINCAAYKGNKIVQEADFKNFAECKEFANDFIAKQLRLTQRTS